MGARKLASLVLGVPEEKIDVECGFLSGGFGGKFWSWPHTLLAAVAAKVVKQLTRAPMCSLAGRQAATVQTVGRRTGAKGLGEPAAVSVAPTILANGYATHQSR